MPRYIGHDPAPEMTRISGNAHPIKGERVRLSWAQARLLHPSKVMASEDSTDTGARGRRAKRWFRWFANPSDILACPGATVAMRARAGA